MRKWATGIHKEETFWAERISGVKALGWKYACMFNIMNDKFIEHTIYLALTIHQEPKTQCKWNQYKWSPKPQEV